jgi:hypothetical protein
MEAAESFGFRREQPEALLSIEIMGHIFLIPW